MASEETSWAHTRAEWDQAWSQARHFEAMRGQWLGFFFTAVLGSTVIAGPKLDANSSRSILVIAVLALILELCSAALYLAVARLNEIQLYNDEIIRAIRKVAMSEPPAAVDLTRFKNPPRPPRGAGVGDLASTKKVSEMVLLVGVVVFLAVLAGDVARAATFSRISTVALVSSALAACAGLVIAGFCVWARREGKPPTQS